MPLTTNYDLVSFDAAQAIMYLRVRVLDGATVIETNEDVPVRIPVDVSGTVPVGAALTGVLDRAIARTFSETTLAEKERLYNIESNGGLVVNRAAIYALTEQGENGTVETTLVSIEFLVPVTTMLVASGAGISVGSTFGLINVSPGETFVTGVDGNRVNFSPSVVTTPNAIPGSTIIFFAP
jgi:hypothetical protein